MGKRIVIALGGNCPTGRFASRGGPSDFMLLRRK